MACAGIPKGPGHYAEGRIPIGGGAVRWSLARGAPSLARGRRHRRDGRHRWSQGRRHWLKGRHYWRKRRRAAVTGWKELFFFNEESPNEVPDDYSMCWMTSGIDPVVPFILMLTIASGLIQGGITNHWSWPPAWWPGSISVFFFCWHHRLYHGRTTNPERDRACPRKGTTVLSGTPQAGQVPTNRPN